MALNNNSTLIAGIDAEKNHITLFPASYRDYDKDDFGLLLQRGLLTATNAGFHPKQFWKAVCYDMHRGIRDYRRELNARLSLNCVVLYAKVWGETRSHKKAVGEMLKIRAKGIEVIFDKLEEHHATHLEKADIVHAHARDYVFEPFMTPMVHTMDYSAADYAIGKADALDEAISLDDLAEFHSAMTEEEYENEGLLMDSFEECSAPEEKRPKQTPKVKWGTADRATAYVDELDKSMEVIEKEAKTGAWTRAAEMLDEVRSKHKEQMDSLFIYGAINTYGKPVQTMTKLSFKLAEKEAEIIFLNERIEYLTNRNENYTYNQWDGVVDNTCIAAMNAGKDAEAIGEYEQRRKEAMNIVGFLSPYAQAFNELIPYLERKHPTPSYAKYFQQCPYKFVQMLIADKFPDTPQKKLETSAMANIRKLGARLVNAELCEPFEMSLYKDGKLSTTTMYGVRYYGLSYAETIVAAQQMASLKRVMNSYYKITEDLTKMIVTSDKNKESGVEKPFTGKDIDKMFNEEGDANALFFNL